MKIWLGIFGLFSIIGIAMAQGNSPEWFVLENKEGMYADEKREETRDIAKESLFGLNVGVDSSIFNQEVGERARFANNGKDLELASNWLKKEFENGFTQNILLSPLDFYFSSVLLANGVVDQTLFEFSKMFSVMRLPEVTQQIKFCIKQRHKSVFMNLALWGKVFSEHFTEIMKKQLGAEIWGLEDTTAAINNWIKAKTNGEIDNVIAVGPVHDADMFLVSSAYFEAPWLKPILASQIEKREAYNLSGKVVETQMFQSELVTDYFENEEMIAVKLFYSSGDYISLFMPKESNNFADFVEELNASTLKPNFEKRIVSVVLPKIELEYQSFMIKDIFAMLGIRRLFEAGNYEFAKMISFDTTAFIKDVLLKAKMKIDEGITVDEDLSENEFTEDLKKAVFIANHPFVFMINNGDFIGAVVKFD